MQKNDIGPLLTSYHIQKLIFIYFLAAPCGMLLVLQPRIQPTPPKVKVQSLHHWTTREVPNNGFWYATKTRKKKQKVAQMVKDPPAMQ